MGAVSSGFERLILREEDKIASELGIPWEDMRKNLETALRETSDADILRSVIDVRNQGLHSLKPTTKDNLLVSSIVRLSPIILLLVATNLLIHFIAWTYFLTYFTSAPEKGVESAERLPRELLRQGAEVFWMLFRSLLWIPIVGIIFAVYFLPRFAFAPVFLASGQCGIRESLALSSKRTSGNWGRTVFWLLGLLLLAAIFLWASLFFVASTVIFLPKLGILLWLFALYTSIAILAAGLTVAAAEAGLW